jgi:hypothetical protein
MGLFLSSGVRIRAGGRDQPSWVGTWWRKHAQFPKRSVLSDYWETEPTDSVILSTEHIVGACWKRLSVFPDLWWRLKLCWWSNQSPIVTRSTDANLWALAQSSNCDTLSAAPSIKRLNGCVLCHAPLCLLLINLVSFLPSTKSVVQICLEQRLISPVSIVTKGTYWNTEESWFYSRQGQDILPVLHRVSTGWGPPNLLSSGYRAGVSAEVRRLGREAQPLSIQCRG